MRLFLLLFATAYGLAAQELTPRLSFGVTGGVPLGQMTPGPSSFYSEESRRYAVGPTFDLFLTNKLSVTVNPLYKRLGSSTSPFPYFYGSPDGPYQYLSQSTRMRAHSLELPVIGKYHLGNEGNRWRPFVGAGFAFHTAWTTTNNAFVAREVATGTLTFTNAGTNRRTPTDVGAVLSTGFEFSRGPLHFAPEIRYTRWGSASLARDRHQADALLTIRFGGRGH